MSVISITKLYELLSTKAGKETAENLTNFIEYKIKDEVENKSQTLATKEDIFILKDDLHKEVTRLELKISQTKAETIKWMFIFWIGQVVATFGFILLFLKR